MNPHLSRQTGRTTARLWCVIAVIATLALGPIGLRASHAAGMARRERARTETMLADIERVHILRASLATTGTAEADSGVPLATRVAGVLSAAGLAQSNLGALSPESTTQRSGGGTTVRRRATMTLQSLTLPELGRFLAEWRSREPSWTVTSIDLNPQERAKPTPGADLPIRAVVLLESLSFESSRPVGQP
jgi:hypothetical protein